MSGDVFSVIRDVPDPVAGSRLRGRSQGLSLTRTALARPVIRWRDYFLTADVYDEPDPSGLGGALSVHLYCPLCAMRAGAGAQKHNALMIHQRNKKIEIDFSREPHFRDIQNAELLAKLRLADGQAVLHPGSAAWRGAYREAFAAISIEPFKCAWEGEFGLCSWRVEVVDNIARDL